MLKRMRTLSFPLMVAGIFLLGMCLLAVRLDALAQTTNQDAPITWLFNARANSDLTNFGQHEPHLAISRTDPNVVVAVAKDYRNGDGNKQVWIYVSQDGGHTWPLEKQLQIPGLPADVPNQSDPVAVARDDGRMYVISLGYDQYFGQGHGLFITWSDDNGNTWQDPSVVITHNQTGGGLDDKEWLAIDNYPDSPYYHNMYVAWATGGIQFKRSSDGGNSWSPSNPTTIAPGDTEYPYPVVGPDGTLYVFYMDGWGYCARGNIRFVKSTDGGYSFTGPFTQPLLRSLAAQSTKMGLTSSVSSRSLPRQSILSMAMISGSAGRMTMVFIMGKQMCFIRTRLMAVKLGVTPLPSAMITRM